MLVQRVLILLWKYLLVKEEELFYCWKASKFLLAALFANARRVDVSKFRVEKTAILRLRPRKLIFFRFSKIKAFCKKNLHQLTYLPKSYIWTKNEENRSFNSCHSLVDISWPSLFKQLSQLTLPHTFSYVLRYLEKQAFLQRADERQFEKEKKMREIGRKT